MKKDNSSYTVTSPDLMLTHDGINVCISTTDKELSQNVRWVFEKYIQSSIIFNIQDTITTENNLPWLFYVSGPADFLVIDLDTCAWIDICLALKKVKKDHQYIMFINQRNMKPDAVKLINALGEDYIFDSSTMLDDFIREHIIEKGNY